MDMKLQDIKINGLDKKDYILQTENNGFILKSKGDYALPYGQTIEITYTVKSGVLTNGKVIDNTAVSYTHLDVYKRQQVRNFCCEELPVRYEAADPIVSQS